MNKIATAITFSTQSVKGYLFQILKGLWVFEGKEEAEGVETRNLSQGSVSDSSGCSTELPALDLRDYSGYKLNSSDLKFFEDWGNLGMFLNA